jgi:hypothetical protein
VTDKAGDDYSQIADSQLDAIEAGGDAKLYNAILDACQLVFSNPDLARQTSTAISTEQGVRMALAVRGHHPYKVFWDLSGPRIEAVFPYDSKWELPKS